MPRAQPLDLEADRRQDPSRLSSSCWCAILNLDPYILQHFECHEWRHASAILRADFPEEMRDIEDVLTQFKLYQSKILTPGGAKSDIAGWIDGEFLKRGWQERKFDTQIKVDQTTYDTPTHKVDCFKNRVALEIEWNNKDPFYDRDLNNFRLLFELRAISVGVIVTRCSELQQIFDELGKGKSYGNSTTHMAKLLPRIEGGGGGGCPILVLGISPSLYVRDMDDDQLALPAP